jgi:2-desacetyl-2-hydroxyethyl bacteriochlorophyllide A dehydrogenase
MRAAVLRELPADRLHVTEVGEPDCPPGSVVVEMSACGICGTDLHIMDGTSYRPVLPFVLGHEPVGTVVSVSPGADPALAGRRVAAAIFVGCGRCMSCRAGNERLCEDGARVTGVLGLWGGFAERLVLGADHIVDVPAGLDDVAAASLVDAGPTAHNAARVALEGGRPRSSSVVVAGAGPVGLVLAELLKADGVTPVLIEPNPLRRAMADQRGFAAVASLSETGPSVDVLIDCAGVPDAIVPMLARLAPHGLYVSVGYAAVPLLDLGVVARRELTIRGVRSGTRADLIRVLRLAADGTIRPPDCRTWPIEGINDALGDLRGGRLAGKAVITMAARQAR